MFPTILRTIGLYFGFLAFLRWMGKREVGQFTPFDLVVILILAEIADGVIFGDVPVGQGTAAVLTIGVLELGNSWLSFRSPRYSRWVEGKPTVLIRDGIVQEEALRRERIRREELFALLRLEGKGEDEIPEIERATLEVNGELSVLCRRQGK
jgi:uncharacterized membrane protein YcaP (DUF421 family)